MKPEEIQLHDTVLTRDGVEGRVLAMRRERVLIGYGNDDRTWRQASTLTLVKRYEPRLIGDPFARFDRAG